MQGRSGIITALTMVLILDGNPEIGAHVRSNLCYLICLRHLIKYSGHKSDFVFSEKTLY